MAPQLSLVALSSGDAWLEVGKPGASPNLGGIITDHPTRLRNLMEERGLKPGPSVKA
ncbi:hypothetical protein [Arthrobacter sp. Soil736]|uniref:hypothetical protein n=1 Tax=Arthrobacter sp. Soil736 TaxID=1736395 RepID=UPI000AC982CC|nr:hypothetical protein [Arthrobacter sp. Soil736]